jgi:hypothetical protein
MVLRSAPGSAAERKTIISSHLGLTDNAATSPGEWLTASITNTPGPDVQAKAWCYVSGLTSDEAADLLGWLETTLYPYRQISYQTGKGFTVRFQ